MGMIGGPDRLPNLLALGDQINRGSLRRRLPDLPTDSDLESEVASNVASDIIMVSQFTGHESVSDFEGEHANPMPHNRVVREAHPHRNRQHLLEHIVRP